RGAVVIDHDVDDRLLVTHRPQRHLDACRGTAAAGEAIDDDLGIHQWNSNLVVSSPRLHLSQTQLAWPDDMKNRLHSRQFRSRGPTPAGGRRRRSSSREGGMVVMTVSIRWAARGSPGPTPGPARRRR